MLMSAAVYVFGDLRETPMGCNSSRVAPLELVIVNIELLIIRYRENSDVRY